MGAFARQLVKYAFSSSGPYLHDPALRQVAFVGFPKELGCVHRVEAPVFMKTFFANMPVKHIDVPLNKDSQMTTHGFATCAPHDFHDQVSGSQGGQF